MLQLSHDRRRHRLLRRGLEADGVVDVDVDRRRRRRRGSRRVLQRRLERCVARQKRRSWFDGLRLVQVVLARAWGDVLGGREPI